MGRTYLVEQAATLLRVSRRTIYNMMKDGRLVAKPGPGGGRRVTEESMVRLGWHPQIHSTTVANTMMTPTGRTRWLK